MKLVFEFRTWFMLNLTIRQFCANSLDWHPFVFVIGSGKPDGRRWGVQYTRGSWGTKRRVFRGRGVTDTIPVGAVL